MAFKALLPRLDQNGDPQNISARFVISFLMSVLRFSDTDHVPTQCLPIRPFAVSSEKYETSGTLANFQRSHARNPLNHPLAQIF